MEKRTLLAIVLSMAILFAWGILFDQTKNKPSPEPKQAPQAAAPNQSKPEAKTLTTAPATVAQAPAMAASTITVDTPLYTATFSTRGAQVISLKLKKYLTTMDKDAKPVEILKAPMPGLMLSGGISDAGLVFESSQPSSLSITDKPQIIEFRSQAYQGILLKKVFTIDPKTYVLGYQAIIENHTPSAVSVSGETVFSNAYGVDEKSKGYAFEGPVLLNGKHLEEFKVDKVKTIGGYRDFTGDIKWFGFEDKYFLQTIIPKTTVSTTLIIKRPNDKSVEMHYAFAPSTLHSGGSLVKDNLIFLGPKELKPLEAVGYSLNKALDFGFFDIIAKPLLISMNWIYKYVGSYGWTIIILTIIIKFLLYPLTLKSFTSMKELQKIQPLMKEIQQQYKDDKQKMNQELMRLYQEHKINPMGGCLPMLLQIPILFALYKVFYQAIELRHTPFHIFGTWLPDLSASDPYYITPILMGASQFVMQKMTPTTGDPMQQKVMLFMPVLFTFMFLNFPSGLVIYWLISNILSIFQQAYINRKHT